MKKLVISALVLGMTGFVGVAQADTNTITANYAQSKVKDFKDVKGVNFKYRFEWDSPVSVISSFTYLDGKEGGVADKVDLKYFSLGVGPAYRINEYASVYAIVGVNYNKVKTTVASVEEKKNSTDFAYGVGVQLNPLDYLAIDIGYEGAKVKFAGGKKAANGFNIGVGYRF